MIGQFVSTSKWQSAVEKLDHMGFEIHDSNLFISYVAIGVVKRAEITESTRLLRSCESQSPQNVDPCLTAQQLTGWINHNVG